MWRFSFNKWLRVWRWNPDQKRENELSLAFDFAKQKPEDQEASRLKIRVHTKGDKLIRPDVSDRTGPLQNEHLVKAGDVIQTETWKLTIHRIVYPDDEQDLAGWLDVELQTVPGNP